MESGGRTPEELETLLEDACVLRDGSAFAGLFEEHGLLVVGGALSRGQAEIARAGSLIWNPCNNYVAETRRIFQARRTVLILGEHATSVVVRDRYETWRYVISVHTL